MMGHHSSGNGTMALEEDYTLHTWGQNGYGQLGITHGHTAWVNISRSSPNQITSGTGSFIHVASSGHHKAAIDTENRLYMWGHNNYGQLGQNNTSELNRPTKINKTTYDGDKRIY